MASDPKAASTPPSTQVKQRDPGIRIFTYPKLIFIFPTMIAALICGIGMELIGDRTSDPIKLEKAEVAAKEAKGEPVAVPAAVTLKHERFMTSQNLLGILFLGIFTFNLLIMAIDFPRFTVVAIVLLVLLGLFFLLWIAAYFDADLLKPARVLVGGIYVVANSGFYFMVAAILALNFAVIYVTRYLDYWEILPNEILHHHGPLSDLERYPTLNLKFDKEIPDVFEFLLLGAGKIVLHVTEERKAIVMENVLFINAKEEGLKRMMSRLEVRVTTDQEVSQP
ncbi:hypothetical protein [Singulisphaera acidiphila]|uniref:Uncharacterized protein n=1 Tax=Singulisphaera acidiphila (strain ATCC BAA-1392 / DSM 18658 / VKM B-2454 / MOB10) TaxID=886293 RepID=L0DID9_SINAD|nr:hypothetical protein [Singulisphaera acidiphila]AGA29164.1 hypothetical protein Sinac_5010 [Singulisphaera acidiphila DSM 18658]